MIKLMFLEKTKVRVCLVIISIVEVFEGVKVWFALLGFQSRGVELAITFITPSKILVVFRFVGSVTFDTF